MVVDTLGAASRLTCAPAVKKSGCFEYAKLSVAFNSCCNPFADKFRHVYVEFVADVYSFDLLYDALLEV